MNPGVPVFSSETYPGWLTHWGEKWARPGVDSIVGQVKWLMDNKKSFNLYVIHGGTNFGFTAGANSGGKGYEPDLTSYDYDAPVNEQGGHTAKYDALRTLMAGYSKSPLPEVPEAIPCVAIPEIEMSPLCSVWDNLPAAELSAQPKTFEAYGQDYGLRLYRTKLIGHKSGRLHITNVHDYATVFLNGKYIGKIDRRLGENGIDIPESSAKEPVLEILVEAMGRINFADQLIDRKGITDRVTLNGMTLMEWESFGLPLKDAWVSKLAPSTVGSKPGVFFCGTFLLDKAADTYIDMSNYTKGIVWVNGHNLGRYWEIGPQKRLYCPAPWLKKGANTITVLDLHQLEAKPLSGKETLE